MTKILYRETCMARSDAYGSAGKKKKHWDVCIETSQCLIPIIGMFFSNLPMFFPSLQKDKKTQSAYVTISYPPLYMNHELSC